MDNKNVSLPGIEDILDLTDTEDSSSSSNQAIFDVQEPFVLELHELIKDEPGTDSVAPESNVNVKKHKKKKKSLSPHIKRDPSDSSVSVSEVSSMVPSVDEPSKEEYFDAHESYHTMPEYPVSTPLTGTSLTQTHSENVSNPKAPQPATVQRPPIPSREPSTAIDKPVTPPE
ncbi:uncharacterized protein LOC115445674 [Manduca sexta]|uniref:uncharacterized protein LOC115445674 n=1 Tax=Manduca sexta TaxID=7130 RepID=UPI00118333D2|nr:uncharacterized protein LOC115445674 [Manduca sexta]